MSTTNGKALGVKPDDDKGPDVEGFNLRAWVSKASLVTRSVSVCGMPQLMGLIEALKDELERTQAAEFDDDRPLVKTQAMRLAEQLEAARTEMLGSMVTFRFRGLRPGEFDKIKAAHGEEDVDPEPGSDLDYKVWAAQCVQPAGVTWEDFKLMHRGNDEEGDDAIEGLGAYFLNTIGRTANMAASGGSVDVPFSSASSSLMASSSKS